MTLPLELSTKVAPGRPIDLDGQRFEMLTMDHLSPDLEAEVMALFSRHATWGATLEVAPNKPAGEKAAKQLRTCRVLLLEKLTTIPRDLIDELPISAQAKLLDAIQEEMAIQVNDPEGEEDLGARTEETAKPPEGGDGGDEL